AWSRFHRDYGPAIFRQLLAATRGDHHLASEALQKAYLRVARHARPCDSEPEFGAWLRIVARSALNDCFRRRRTFRDLLRRRAEAPPGEDDASREEALNGALDAALASLPEGDRSLLERKYFAGVDVRTLAAQLDLTPKAVESRLTRARAELRRLVLVHLSR